MVFPWEDFVRPEKEINLLDKLRNIQDGGALVLDPETGEKFEVLLFSSFDGEHFWAYNTRDWVFCIPVIKFGHQFQEPDDE